jgi:hypothetical protein
MSESQFSKTNDLGIVFALAVLAAIVIWLATRFGIGVTPDSTVYIDAAQKLLDGRGLVVLKASGEWKPLTHYPPLYPSVLALLARVGDFLGGFSIETVARSLNSVLFGANVLLVGMAIRSYARDSYRLPILGAALTLTAPDIAGIHTFALTEGLFIFLSLSGLFSLARFIDTGRRAWLIASAAVIALALLTRYVGVTLVFTGVLVLLFVNGRTFRKRCFDALSFGLIACLPMALWVVRNMHVGDGSTDREYDFHLVRLRQIAAGLSTVSAWLLLGKVRTDYRVIFFVVEVAATSLFVIYVLRKSRANALVYKDHPDDAAAEEAGELDKSRSPSPLPIVFLVFIVSYVAFLIFTTFFVDADTVLDDRALVSVHVAAIILGSCFAWKIFVPVEQRRAIRLAFVVLAIVFVGSYAFRGARWFLRVRQDGQVYSSRAWRESETIARIRNLPVGVPIYSNGYDAVYYFTGRPAIYIPEKINHATGRQNENYESEVKKMSTDLKQRNAALVYFHTLPERWFLPSEAELVQRVKPRRAESNLDGSIFTGGD